MYSSKYKCTGSCSLPICSNYFFLHLWMNVSICQNVSVLHAHTRLHWGEKQKPLNLTRQPTWQDALALWGGPFQFWSCWTVSVNCLQFGNVFVPTEIWNGIILISQNLEMYAESHPTHSTSMYGRNLKKKKERSSRLCYCLVTLVSILSHFLLVSVVVSL